MAEDSFAVRVTPKASRERMAFEGEVLKVWVTAPPVDGAANKAVQGLLAKSLGVAKGKVRLVRGEGSREKEFVVEGMSGLEAVGVLRERLG